MKRWRLAAVVASIALVGCGGDSPLVPTPAPDPPPVAADAYMVAAGDIGWCGVPEPEATARLLDINPGAVAALGDIAYPDGSTANLQNCFQPSWGRHKARIRPVPGNHDYHSPNASPYFAYFGSAAGNPGEGYYSYKLESWHVIALNSNIGMNNASPQFAWLKDDLQNNPSLCTVVYWHHPLFSSGPSGGHSRSRDVWRALYDARVELVLVGDDHAYERFAPQDPDGRPDPSLGIRQFTVGTGGAPLYDVARMAPNSEARSKTHGVLRLTLKSGRYDWEFLPIAGQSFRDFGSTICH